MILTLEVTGPQASALGHARRKEFGPEGGTIGRLPDNDWVLSEPYVSGRHAIIRFMDGVFHIEDTSTNGVFLNSSPERIVRGRLYPIKTGDRIGIDPYDILVHVSEGVTHASKAVESSDSPFAGYGQPLSDSFLEPAPLEMLGTDPDSRSEPQGTSGSELSGGSPLWAHYTPPAVESDGTPELIPSNWQDSNSVIAPSPSVMPAKPQPPGPAPVVKPGARSPAGGALQDNAGLAALFREAGIDDDVLTPELARDLGRIFRIVVSGVMDVLKARQQTKDQFGLGMTSFKRADNNPLKFSADVEDALQRLFGKRTNTTYLGPVAAFEDAFEDMRNHQIAMLVGVRVAFEAMLSEFDPDHLQEQFDRQIKKGALVSMPARLRYWDLYRDWIRDMVRDADTSFRELFGDEFARAYEEQLTKLKAQGRAGKG